MGAHPRQQGIDLAEHLGSVDFTSPHTLRASDGRNWSADRIIILAVGAMPPRLPVPGAELALTYNDIPSLTALPGNAAIVGSADTGCQIASILADFGIASACSKPDPRCFPPPMPALVRTAPRLPGQEHPGAHRHSGPEPRTQR